MKQPILLLVLVLVGIYLYSNGIGNAGFTRITMAEAADRLAQETGYVLLDVRTPEEYADGHIPGAKNLPLQSIGKTQPSMLPDTAQRVYVYCRSGQRSRQAARRLVKLGYTDVVNIGGINRWTGDVVTGRKVR